jgi:Berberine and berberine like
VSFYKERLFNHHWGEQARAAPDNRLEIQMNSWSLTTAQAQEIWQPFLDWVAASDDAYSFDGRVVVGSIPARQWWNPQWWNEHWPEIAFPRNGNPLIELLDDALVHVVANPAWKFDPRAGADPIDGWWAGSTGEVAWFISGYESLWLPEALLQGESRARLADALFAASRHSSLALHFNKGLAGAPPEAIAAARDTAVNPAVTSAFALVIAANGEGPAYPGITGFEPAVGPARAARQRIRECMAPLRSLVPDAAAYVSESNYFESGWQKSYWGSNYPRLAAIKKRYDPTGLFVVHNGVGSEQWSADGFTRV